MISPRCPHFRARLAAFLALAAGAASLSLFSCSADPASTLGSEGDLLGSEPGEVIQDTIGVFDDTTYAFNTAIATDTDLEVGIDSLYEHIIVLQPGFAELTTTPGDAQRTVQEASLHLGTTNLTQTYPVRFYGLERKYTDGDTISIGDLPDSLLIPDPDAGSVERILEAFPPTYPLPPTLVQEWIRDSQTTPRQAIAIVYTDTANERVALISSEDATADQPYLQVRFTDSVQRSYDIRDAATVYRPRTSTTHLVVSDGYPRRVFLRAELDSLADDAAVHTANMRFHIVPETLAGTTTTLLLYIPDSMDPTKPEFKTGQRITEQLIAAGDDTVDFPLTNALFLVLQGTLKNNGFAIRFKDENTQLRQVELYGTGAPDSLRPRVYVTTSRPAVFN